MSRTYYVTGETIVKLKGGDHLQSFGMSGSSVVTLGVTDQPISVTQRFRHQDIYSDKTERDIGADVMWKNSDILLNMNLIHFDNDLVEVALSEAMDGYSTTDNSKGIPGGMLGHNIPLYSSGCRFMSVGLTSSVTSGRVFYCCYLAEQPYTIPLGTTRSSLRLNFRAFRYAHMDTSGFVATPHLLWAYANL